MTVMALAVSAHSTTPAVANDSAIVRVDSGHFAVPELGQPTVKYTAHPFGEGINLGGLRIGPLEAVLAAVVPIVAIILAIVLKKSPKGSSSTNASDPTTSESPNPGESEPSFSYQNCDGRDELTRGCELKPDNWVRRGEHLRFGLSSNGEIQYRVGTRVVGKWGGTGSGRVLRLNEEGRVLLQVNDETVYTLFGDRPQVDRVMASSDGYLVGYNGAEKVWNDMMFIDALKGDWRLGPDQMLLSRNGRFFTIYQSDGNLVTYHDYKPIWESGTTGKTGADMFAIMQTDGNFVIYVNGRAEWATGTMVANGQPSDVWVNNEGELRVFRESTPIWSSRRGKLEQPAPNNGIAARVDAFVNKYNNRIWDYDGAYGAQCTDLFQFYNRDVVNAPYERFGGNGGAKNLWHVRTNARNEHYHFLGAGTRAQKGDVAVWDKIGPRDQWGHVAIVLEDRGDSLLLLSQNNHAPYAGNTPTGIITMRKSGLLGYLRPKR